MAIYLFENDCNELKLFYNSTVKSILLFSLKETFQEYFDKIKLHIDENIYQPFCFSVTPHNHIDYDKLKYMPEFNNKLTFDYQPCSTYYKIYTIIDLHSFE